MFIYNITNSVSNSIHEAWLKWMKEEHIPAVMNTNCFTGYQVLKLHEQHNAEGPTYIIQYFAESKALYNRYIEMYADKLRKETIDKWGENFIAFRTLLEVLE